tara:strand:- start:376 stop:558 length:183 start_codon:yes stop_codon:yes gene_type:complete
MTPFEQAEHNLTKMAERLILHNLVWATIEDTKEMSEEEQEFIWQTVIALIEASGVLDDVN